MGSTFVVDPTRPLDHLIDGFDDIADHPVGDVSRLGQGWKEQAGLLQAGVIDHEPQGYTGNCPGQGNQQEQPQHAQRRRIGGGEDSGAEATRWVGPHVGDRQGDQGHRPHGGAHDQTSHTPSVPVTGQGQGHQHHRSAEHELGNEYPGPVVAAQRYVSPAVGEERSPLETRLGVGHREHDSSAQHGAQDLTDPGHGRMLAVHTAGDQHAQGDGRVDVGPGSGTDDRRGHHDAEAEGQRCGAQHRGPQDHRSGSADHEQGGAKCLGPQNARIVLHGGTVRHTDQVTIGTLDPTVVPRVAVLTARECYPLHDVDRELTAAALTRAGMVHELVPWDAAVDWAGFDLVVIRSTWDYTEHLAAFMDTLAHIHTVTRLVNSVDVVRWNVDKRYLADLAAAGVPVVPTQYLTPGVDPGPTIGQLATPLVVKPVVSAGAKNTARHDCHDDATAHAQQLLHDGSTIMVQPYLGQVNDHGETGLVYLAGTYSHAFRKAPILTGADGAPETTGDGVLVERITQRQASPQERAVGDVVMTWLSRRFTTLAYARVDLLPTPAGPVVLEVELVEPNLFFTMCHPAADLFAQHLLGRCR